MVIALQIISGCMFGFEFVWGHALIVDLAIFRVIFYYGDQKRSK